MQRRIAIVSQILMIPLYLSHFRLDSIVDQVHLLIIFITFNQSLTKNILLFSIYFPLTLTLSPIGLEVHKS